MTGGGRAQAIVSSHSASILARVPPDRVRHFRLDLADRTALVRRIRLPEGEEEAEKYVREAVRAYPELYFARLVVLGEGASEEIVLPRLATALGLDVDPSFVAVVPLGGRHVNHFWRLLDELAIPHLTLLDLDLGRDGGAWGRIKSTCAQLLQLGIPAPEVFGNGSVDDVDAKLALFDNTDPANGELLDSWLTWLRRFGVFFCAPLDLDYMMLTAFPGAYQVIEEGRRGPSATGDPRTAVLGESGRPDLYDGTHDQRLRWYRYLFLGRGKPSTHVRVLGSLDDEALAAQTPEVLRGLLSRVIEILYGGDQTATDEG